MFKRIVALLISVCFAFEQVGFAQVAPQLQVPQYLSTLMTPDRFRPVQLRSIELEPAGAGMRIFVDRGDEAKLNADALKLSSAKLLEYFQIGLRLPNSTFWVNLRPDTTAEIIDPVLEKTDLGKVLLAADLQLKKDLAQMTSPDTVEGHQYWIRLYAKAAELYGDSQDMQIPTVTRPWIVPGEVVIRQTRISAYVYKASLKVMLEQDYLKGDQQFAMSDPRAVALNDYSSALIRELIIPKLTRRVNASRKYADLRQVYYSLVLAQWFKARFKDSRIDNKDIAAFTSQKSWSKDTYYQQYKKSFEQGEYKKEETVTSGNNLFVRQYVSGGVQFAPSRDGGQMAFTSINALRTNMDGIQKGLSEITVNEDKMTLISDSDLVAELGNRDGGVTQQKVDELSATIIAEMEKVYDLYKPNCPRSLIKADPAAAAKEFAKSVPYPEVYNPKGEEYSDIEVQGYYKASAFFKALADTDSSWDTIAALAAETWSYFNTTRIDGTSGYSDSYSVGGSSKMSKQEIEEKKQDRQDLYEQYREEEEDKMWDKVGGQFGRSYFDGLTSSQEDEVRVNALNRVADEMYGPRYEIVNGRIREEDIARDGGTALTEEQIIEAVVNLPQAEQEQQIVKLREGERKQTIIRELKKFGETNPLVSGEVGIVTLANKEYQGQIIFVETFEAGEAVKVYRVIGPRFNIYIDQEASALDVVDALLNNESADFQALRRDARLEKVLKDLQPAFRVAEKEDSAYAARVYDKLNQLTSAEKKERALVTIKQAQREKIHERLFEASRGFTGYTLLKGLINAVYLVDAEQWKFGESAIGAEIVTPWRVKEVRIYIRGDADPLTIIDEFLNTDKVFAQPRGLSFRDMALDGERWESEVYLRDMLRGFQEEFQKEYEALDFSEKETVSEESQKGAVGVEAEVIRIKNDIVDLIPASKAAYDNDYFAGGPASTLEAKFKEAASLSEQILLLEDMLAAMRSEAASGHPYWTNERVAEQRRLEGLLEGVKKNLEGKEVDSSRDGGVVSQTQIGEKIKSSAAQVIGYVKDVPIMMYKVDTVDAKGYFSELPEEIRQQMGAMDNAEDGYRQAWNEGKYNNGYVVALQIDARDANNPKPDFYVMGMDSFNERYKQVGIDEVKEKNNEVFNQLMDVSVVNGRYSAKDAKLIGALKTQTVDMVKMSEAGFAQDRKAEIEAPWGGSQTKEAGNDAFLVLEGLEGGSTQYYMVQDNGQGLPQGYVLLDASARDGGKEKNVVGGIDFRAVPLPVAAGAVVPVMDMKALQALAANAKIADVDAAWKAIEKDIAQKTVPYEQLKNVVAVSCCQKDTQRLSEISARLAQLLKLEEECAVTTSAQMQEVLQMLEAAA